MMVKATPAQVQAERDQAIRDYFNDELALRERTAKLRAQRLARDAALPKADAALPKAKKAAALPKVKTDAALPKAKTDGALPRVKKAKAAKSVAD